MARVTLQAAILTGAITVAVMTVLSGPVVHYLLGVRYNDLFHLLVPLAALSGMRICKSGPSVVALARGRTGNAMISNLPRLVALPLVWIVLENGGGLLQIVWLGLGAEFLGYSLAMFLVRKQGVGVPYAAIGLFLAHMAATLAMSLSLDSGYLADWPWAGNYPGLTAVVLLPFLLIAMPDLRHYVTRRRRQPPGPAP